MADRSDDLIATVNGLVADVAQLQRLATSRWGLGLGLAAPVSALTSPVFSIGSVVQDVGLSVTFTSQGTTRQYLIWGMARLQQGGAAGDQVITICNAGNTILAESNQGVTGTTSYGTHTPWNILTFAAGSQTVHMRAVSSAGATLQAVTGGPALLAVFDVGPT